MCIIYIGILGSIRRDREIQMNFFGQTQGIVTYVHMHGTEEYNTEVPKYTTEIVTDIKWELDIMQ